MIHPQEIEDCSTNPVQQEYIRQLLHIYDTHTDDLYDNANLVAALRKTALLIIKDSIRFGAKNNLREEYVKVMVEAAFKNWAGWEDGTDEHDQVQARVDSSYPALLTKK